MGNVILIGFMGCGKTTVGLKLSYRLRQSVIDTDKEIEKEEKRTISDIFATDGEAYFRQRETACLEKMLQTARDKIISVGGGLPMLEENRKLLKQIGKVFYLRAKPETIYQRLKYDTTRPLLRGDNPEGKITELMAKRASFYEQTADVIIDVDNRDFEQIISLIEQAVQ